jgi:hypothetical protein
MLLLELPILYERLFAVCAVGLSIILGIRGIAIQVHDVKNENIRLKKNGEVEWNKYQRVLVHYFQDFLYNFVGSVAAWIALYMLSYRLFIYTEGASTAPLGYLPHQPNLHLGWSGLGFAIVALLGITGKLPQTVEGFILSIGKAVQMITGRVAGG